MARSKITRICIYMVRYWLRQYMHQMWFSQKTPHTSPSRANYGVSFLRIWMKIGRVRRAPPLYMVIYWQITPQESCTQLAGYVVYWFALYWPIYWCHSMLLHWHWDNHTMDKFPKSQNAPVPYPTMLHSDQKCAHFWSEWSIVGYGTSTFWDLWIRSIAGEPVRHPEKYVRV